MSTKLDQAFTSAFIAGDFGLPIAHENMPFTPTGAYAELVAAVNDITPYSLKTSNETDGVFKVILRYPVETGAITPKQKADQIMAAMKIGQKLTYSGQSLTITSHNRQPGAAEEGWYKIVLTLGFRAFLTR